MAKIDQGADGKAESVPLPSIPEVPGPLFRPFTEGFTKALESETNWIALTKLKSEAAIIDDIDHGRVCSSCEGTGEESFFQKGGDTGIVIERREPCLCLLRKHYWREMEKTPARYRRVTLSGLGVDAVTSELPTHKQEQIIEFVQKFPNASYLLCGENGTGKTHIRAHAAAVKAEEEGTIMEPPVEAPALPPMTMRLPWSPRPHRQRLQSLSH